LNSCHDSGNPVNLDDVIICKALFATLLILINPSTQPPIIFGKAIILVNWLIPPQSFDLDNFTTEKNEIK